MKLNLDTTEHNQAVAIQNFYRRCCLAEVSIYSPYAGILGTWWCPVAYKDQLAQKVKKQYPKYEVLVSFPLPDVPESEGKKLFEDYTFN